MRPLVRVLPVLGAGLLLWLAMTSHPPLDDDVALRPPARRGAPPVSPARSATPARPGTPADPRDDDPLPGLDEDALPTDAARDRPAPPSGPHPDLGRVSSWLADVPAWLRGLTGGKTHEDWHARDERIRVLRAVLIAHPDRLGPLLAAFGGLDAAHQRLLMVVLGRLPLDGARALLFAVASDPAQHSAVRQMALDGLGQQGEMPACEMRYSSPALHDFPGPDTYAPTPRLRALLKRLMTRDGEDIDVRRRAAGLLSGVVTRALQERRIDDGVRQVARELTAELARASEDPALERGLIFVLHQLAARRTSEGLLRDPDPDGRGTARMWTLSQDATRTPLERGQALTLFRALGGPEVNGRLIELAESDPPRALMQRTLWAIDPAPEVNARLLALVRRRLTGERGAALRRDTPMLSTLLSTASQIGLEARPLLSELAQSAEVELIRLEAARTLRTIEHRAENHRRYEAFLERRRRRQGR